MISLLEVLGVPREFGITMLGFAFALSLVPHLDGHDFGMIKLPTLTAGQSRVAKFLGPAVLLVVALAHAPLISKLRPSPNAVAFVPYLVAKGSQDLGEIAEAFSTQITFQLVKESRLALASTRTARLMSERDTSARIAEELNVAHLVEGTIEVHQGDKITLSTHLIEASTKRTRTAWETCINGIPSRQKIAEISARLAANIVAGILNPGGPRTSRPDAAPVADTCIEIPQPPGRASILLGFNSNSSELSQSAHATLKILASAIDSPKLKGSQYLIESHVRSIGDPAKEAVLSDRRALAVKAALAAYGVDPTRLATIGKGATDSSLPAPADDRVVIALLSQ